jgi:hypothetical protein
MTQWLQGWLTGIAGVFGGIGIAAWWHAIVARHTKAEWDKIRAQEEADRRGGK